MTKFKVTCKSSEGVSTSLELIEKDYPTLWLKLDSLNLKVLKIETVTT